MKIYLPSTEDGQGKDEALVRLAPDGDGERVLVVEDDDTVRMLVLEVLAELGYQAVEFADPLLAVPFLASEERIDLMISDVGLPGMNGRELAEIARTHRTDLPILFVHRLCGKRRHPRGLPRLQHEHDHQALLAGGFGGQDRRNGARAGKLEATFRRLARSLIPPPFAVQAKQGRKTHVRP